MKYGERKRSKPRGRRTVAGSLYRPSYPYYPYERTRLWKVIARAIDDLIENKDLTPTTPVRYIVGYLSMKVSAIPGLKTGERRKTQRRKK